MTIIDKQNTTGGQGSRPSQEHGAGVGIMAEQMMQEAAGKAIPAGYKQTEVGVIPEDWDVLPLNKIANFKNGVAHEDCVCESGKYVLVNSKFISSEGLSEKMSRDCRQPAVANDILMVMSDVPNGKAIAKCYLVNTSGRYTVNQRICILSSQLVNSKYLFYKLNRNPFYLSFDDGAKQTNLRRQDVLDCLLAIPAEVEQIAIANVLSDSDALIDALEQLIAKKQAIKSGTMQQLLTGRTRLPTFALRPDGTPKGYKPSELGDIPEDWEVAPFGNLFETSISRKNLRATEVVSFVGMQDVTETAQLHNQTSITYEKVKTGFTYFECGDVLVAKITPCFENGKGCHTKSLKSDVGFGSTEFHALRATANADSDFIYYWTTQACFRKQLESEMVGSAGHRRVPLPAIQSYMIPHVQNLKRQAN